ncbi:hypothetical protein SHIRM173S_06669 [Streptomyces hirsutus]
MAEAAWACADPGIQYDDTINNWHTCPESGRINGSNPCSEYMHLDNTSCNLASLNLMKFLEDDSKGHQSFDVERFSKVVELVITAMDISICFADFPTQKIGENTRAFRQLGIGYANLGALLMATGHAYDSDGGRALAGAITSLMTGTSYRRSAELAAIVGPYDGYARNAKPHLRVMKQHSDENAKAVRMDDLDTPIWVAATEAWQDVLSLGEKNGFRNSQASVSSPRPAPSVSRCPATPPASSPTSPWSSSRSWSAAVRCRSSTAPSRRPCAAWATTRSRSRRSSPTSPSTAM